VSWKLEKSTDLELRSVSEDKQYKAKMSQAGSDNEDNENGDNTTTKLLAGLEENLEQLSEKRTSTREAALGAYVNAMKGTYLDEFILNKKVTLLEAVKRGLRKGSETEQILSSQLMALLAVTLGTSTEESFQEIAPIFEQVIQNSPYDHVRAEALKNYAMVCFISNPDELVTIAKMAFYRSLLEIPTTKPLTQAAALNGWRLMATTVSRQNIYDNNIPNDLPLFKDFLENDNVDVRVAAGECIGLLFEIARELKEDFDLTEFGNYCGLDVDELIDNLSHLTADKTKQRNKKEKQKQKAPFKEISLTVEDGVSPSETLVFKHQKLQFESWAQITQLDAFRDLLAVGLHAHFESNELLLQIFGIYSFDKQAKKQQMSALEKRMYLSSSSPMAKERTKNLSNSEYSRPA